MGQGVCEVSESHAGRSRQIRAGGQSGGGGGERLAGGGRRLRQSVESVCLEGAVADGRARGKGGAGGRAGAAMIMHHALVCSKRSSGSSSCSRQAGRQARKAALAWMRYYYCSAG